MIATDDALAELVSDLRDEPRYAIDTEFHRERTYFPKVALVQVAWSQGAAMIDPLEVSLKPLAEIFEGRGTAVLHAASQDLEVFDRECGVLPARIFDTQIAAGFLGLTSPSLATLHEHELGKPLPKADRLTDWLRRPLTDRQLAYAAADVADLLEIAGRLLERLEARGRQAWAQDECDALLDRSRVLRDPESAWQRIKECRQLKGEARGIAAAVAAWRERRAAELDLPVRFILSDLAVAGISQRAPNDMEGLRKVRGLDDRHLKGSAGSGLLEAIQKGRTHIPPSSDKTARRDVEPRLRPAVALLTAWIGQLARDHDLDPAVIGSRADIEGLLRSDGSSRLARGWRNELVGERFAALLEGRAALAFDGDAGLVLETRSHTPISPR